jgi:outer membrane murein-binding lipoprotein Lpp
MRRPTIDNESALIQAGDTVRLYLEVAVKMVDDQFGPGFAGKNPAIVAECVRSQAVDYNTTALTAAIYALGDKVCQAAAAIYALGDEVCQAAELIDASLSSMRSEQ